MRKVSCPKCNSKWDKNEYIRFEINRGMPFTITYIKVQDFVFCPVCFFTPKKDNPKCREDYEAKLKRVILQESDVKIKSIVVEDEFGNYLDMNIDAFRKLKISGFKKSQDEGEIDDHTSVWGGAGPDCMFGRLATAK